MPQSIVRFKWLAYAGLLLGIVIAPLEYVRATQDLHGSSAFITSLRIGLAALHLGVLALGWALVQLAAVHRIGWARWLLLLYFAVGVASLALAAARMGSLLIALNLVQRALWSLALYFAFAPADASAWFARTTAQPSAPKPRLRVPAARREVADPAELDHAGKIDAYVAEMAQLGVGSYTAAPPLFRLLWALGLRVPPPLFLGYGALALLMGATFGVLWGVGLGLTAWQTGRSLPIWLALAAAMLAGLLFGLAMAIYYRRKAEALALPAWEDYLPPR